MVLWTQTYENVRKGVLRGVGANGEGGKSFHPWLFFLVFLPNTRGCQNYNPSMILLSNLNIYIYYYNIIYIFR